MQRPAIIISMLGVLFCMSGGVARAEDSPSITQLPKDLARLATVWMAVPQTMYDVSRDDGAAMGLTVGTVAGGTQMVEDTVTYLTSGYHQPARPGDPRPIGALLHYSF